MATRSPRHAAPLAAYVLHRYDWSESSLILDLFTREQGRLAVAAKGAKRPYSQLRGVLLPFQRLNVTLGKVAAHDEGSSDVQTLRGAEWAGGAAMLTGAALFDTYAATLPELAAGADETRVQAALRAFELSLLQQIGLLPDLSLVTLTQQPVRGAARYVLLPESGVADAAPGRDAELSGEALIGLQAALEHGSPAALQHACRSCLAALKLPLRAMIQHHLGTTPLRTRQAMADLQSL